ncbi:MAG TPA: plasmid pRiA4b ORF-3 family protein [Motilibacteraceae bacterium]|nr:plasmid pRiA4b ORF-3 family protein [Motilibacteraceae bacterium]
MAEYSGADDVLRRLQDHLLRSAAAQPGQSVGGGGRVLSPFGAELLAGVQPPTSPRRPRREQEATLRVRVDLAEAKPPIWRRLELSSSLYLDELHEVLQEAFDWDDSHLHRFAVGSTFDPRTEAYLCPFDEDEGEPGVPTREVRLDELLVEPGDRLDYVYDFGDGWEHVIKLEAVLDRAADDPWVRCTGGRRAAPPEDCGGMWGYDEALAEGMPEAPFSVQELDEDLQDWEPSVRDRRDR